MLHGASLKIAPSWVSETVTLDIQWDDDALFGAEPKGKWWGNLAYLGGTGSNEGEWQWHSNIDSLDLWVWVPNSHRRLVAELFDFSFPVSTGERGDGQLAAGLVPATEPQRFTWEGFAGS